MELTVVVCTHDRQRLLDRLLASLSGATRPNGVSVDVLVVANACTDRTIPLVQQWSERSIRSSGFSVKSVEESRKGKSHALNRALDLIDGDLAVFVDDDQRVEHDFFVHLVDALEKHPTVNIFCGRLQPDWDGQEPAWVHDDGRYRIYPPPITTFDAGDAEKQIESEPFKPPGGDLIFRSSLLKRLGRFSTELGPQGHDLGGGEDSEFLKRALSQGERLLYCPRICQYHYVDLERLRLLKLMRMGYQRSRASARIHHGGAGVPLYMWRQAFEYLLSAVMSLSFRRTRFFLVRCAAAFGEIRGLRESCRGPD